jgi:hypothetical protein
MIKSWSQFNENIGRSKSPIINAKIDLLKELSLDLTDIGLEVDIWNGSWRDVSNGDYTSVTSAAKCIIMVIQDVNSVLDKDGYYESHLYKMPEIEEFEKDLKSFGMRPRSRSGGGHLMYYYFDKGGKTTPIINQFILK